MEALLSEAVERWLWKRTSTSDRLPASGVNATSTSSANTADEVYALVNTGLTWLRGNDVKMSDDVVIEVPPYFYYYLKEKLVSLKTDNDELLRKGIVGTYDGCQVRVTNNLYNDNTDDYVMIPQEGDCRRFRALSRPKPSVPRPCSAMPSRACIATAPRSSDPRNSMSSRRTIPENNLMGRAAPTPERVKLLWQQQPLLPTPLWFSIPLRICPRPRPWMRPTELCDRGGRPEDAFDCSKCERGHRKGGDRCQGQRHPRDGRPCRFSSRGFKSACD